MDTLVGVKGLYLYCIRPSGFPYIKPARSVDGKGESFIIPIAELDAVVSEVNLGEFGSEEIQKKAQEDLNWIKEKCQVHEYVIEQAMRSGDSVIPVIPMKFGTIFKSRENLEVSLSENYLRFKDSLAKVKGGHEWAVKAYLKKECFLKWIEEKDKDIKAKKKEIEGMSPGIAFFAQKKLNEMVDRVCFEELQELTQDMFNAISSLAEEKIRAKNLERELTGKKEEMVFNAYFLVKEERLEGFRTCVGKLSEDYASRGLQVVLIGPLPPYHFV